MLTTLLRGENTIKPAAAHTAAPPRLAPPRPAQTLKSTQAMADAMRGATKAMGAMNKRMNLPAMAKIMQASNWYCRGTARIVLPVYCQSTARILLLCWCWFGAGARAGFALVSALPAGRQDVG